MEMRHIFASLDRFLHVLWVIGTHNECRNCQIVSKTMVIHTNRIRCRGIFIISPCASYNLEADHVFCAHTGSRHHQ